MSGGNTHAWFAEEWAAKLGVVLEALAGQRPKLACSPACELAVQLEEISQRHGEIFWWRQPLAVPGQPVVWVGAPQNAWSQLAGRVLGAAGIEDAEQARETYLEILQQAFGELARSAGSRWNIKLDTAGGKASSIAPTDGVAYTVSSSDADAAGGPLLVVVAGSPEDPPDTGQLPATVPLPQASTNGQPQSKTFELLLGVELPISVSFGHVQLPLKDVLKLTAGSIIELNRTVDEPVDVIVNNCVVARGEVVVVEGNYGVRIQQIMSRQERLESLP